MRRWWIGLLVGIVPAVMMLGGCESTSLTPDGSYGSVQVVGRKLVYTPSASIAASLVYGDVFANFEAQDLGDSSIASDVQFHSVGSTWELDLDDDSAFGAVIPTTAPRDYEGTYLARVAVKFGGDHPVGSVAVILAIHLGGSNPSTPPPPPWN